MRRSLGSSKRTSGNRKHEFLKNFSFLFLGAILAVLEQDLRPVESGNILDFSFLFMYGFGSTLMSAFLILIDKLQLMFRVCM